MKRNTRKTILGAATLAAALSLTPPMAAAVDVGVGAGMMFGEGGGGIYVPIRSGNLRVEPELGFYKYSESNTYATSPTSNVEYEYSNLMIGTGVYWRQQVGSSLETYVGGRVGYTRWENKNTYPNNPSNTSSDKTSGYYVGPTFGAEYFFTKQFSFGLDVSLIYSSTSGDYTPNSGSPRSSDDTYWRTEGRTMLRYYF